MKPSRPKRRAKLRPNFILFMTDQQQAGMLGCYGHPLVRTPHIDSIAAGGTCFDRFHVASPSCMPNRASLFTGRLPSAHGVRVNGIPLRRNSNTFVERLRVNGYATALIGKSHLQPMFDLPPPSTLQACATGELPRRGEASIETEDDWYRQERSPRTSAQRREPYYGFEHVELCTGHGDGCGGDYLDWLLSRDPNALAMTGPANALHHESACPQAWRTALPETLYPTRFIADRASAWIDSRALLGDDRPFFLCVSFPDPHHPFTPPGRYWDMYDPKDVVLPDNFEVGPNPPPHLAAAIDERERKVADLNGYGAVRITKPEAREAIARTLGMITMIDDAVGTVLGAVTKGELVDKTVLSFTSDHGDLLGDHGLMFKGPMHYRSLIRVAFVWKDVGGGPCVARSGELAQTIDIGATVLARAGIEAYNGMQGRALLAAMKGTSDAAPDAILIEEEQQGAVLGFGRPTRVRTLVSERHRLSVFSAATWGELYDLQKDPLETTNLWSDPASEGLKGRLMALLAVEMMRHEDESPAPTTLA